MNYNYVSCTTTAFVSSETIYRAKNFIRHLRDYSRFSLAIVSSYKENSLKMHRLLIKRTLLKTSTFRCETTKKQPRTKPCLYDETFLFAVFHGESAVPKYVGTSKSGERAPERENPAYRIGHTLWGPLLPSAVRARDLYRVETSGLVQSLLLSSVPPARSTTWHVCTRHAAMYACTHACT